LVKAGRRLVVVADHTKWGTIGIRTIAHLHEADMVITDDGLSDAARTVLESHVREVRIIPVDHSAEEF
jgi:DeoR/GlpR family transcriptional regulator of sugar metabolism